MKTRNGKATPRPWHVFEGLYFIKIGAVGFDEYVEANHYLAGPFQVGDVNCNATGDHSYAMGKAKANAALIVRAVNEREALLECKEALRAMLRWTGALKPSESLDLPNFTEAEAVYEARKALANLAALDKEQGQ